MPPPNHEVIEEFTDRFALKIDDVAEKVRDHNSDTINILDVSNSSFYSDFFDFVMVSCDLNKCLSKKKSHNNV